LRAGPNVEKVRIEAKLGVMEVVGIAVQLIKRWKVQMVCIDTIGRRRCFRSSRRTEKRAG
jgi:hypothetical protein